ncbi:MAG: polyphosphate polymerase domain-containing protein [Candidatus Saccharibacteria bacterium]|nr:polyphosphate polymerase domain-containing protein [Candidatus Saccharibacteria bacterium]
MNIFRRVEQKYLITTEQYNALMEALGDKLVKDEYFYNDIYNLYLDAPDHRLIIQSIEKPMYKEKFRVRSYGLAENEDSKVYLEIKKKFDGTSHKRRISMTLGEFYKYMEKGNRPKNANPITLAELDYDFEKYNLQPSILINYERYSYYFKGNKDLRITFDHNVKYRVKKPDLTNGDDMHHIIDKDMYIMEIKSLDSLPIKLSQLLAKLKIYPRGFSKPKNAYLKSLERAKQKERK